MDGIVAGIIWVDKYGLETQEYKYFMKTDKYNHIHYIFVCKSLLYHELFGYQK